MEAFAVKTICSEHIREILQLQAECGLSPWSYEDYRDELLRPDAIMLRFSLRDDGCIGFIVGRIVPGDSESPDAEIYNIGVSPKQQRSGVGSSLLQGFLEVCRRAAVCNVWLDVRKANLTAQAFYASFGFETVGTRRGFYNDPIDDSLIMCLVLDRYFLSHEGNIS